MKNSTVIATFVYDGEGKQVKSITNGVTTYYAGQHYQKEGTVVTKYYYAGAERVAMRQGGVLYYIFGDHLGSTAVVKNTQGGKTELRYAAWGTTRYEYGSTPTDRRFTGQREEASLGLYFYNARWYDPALGRFIQADSIVPGAGNPQAWDRYAYANNNPLYYTDPSGHRVCDDEFGDCLNHSSNTNRSLKPSQPPQPRNTSPNLSLIISGDIEEMGPITDFILNLPGSTEDWNKLAAGLDMLAWFTDLYATSGVTYAFFAGAALPAPLIAIGLPEVPLATGVAGMAIAELFVQPVLFTGNVIATFSMGATIVSNTKAGNTRIEEIKFSSNVLNSLALTDLGWMSNEAYLSLTIQSMAVANDLQWVSLPFPMFP